MKNLFVLTSISLFFATVYAQVNTESIRIKSDTVGFSAVAELEFSLMAGNTDFQHLGSNSRLNYNYNPTDHIFLIMNGGFGREDGKTFFSQALFHLRNVNGVSEKLFLEIFIQYDNNKSLLLLERYLAGLGIRYRILDSDNISSRTGISFFAEKELYDLTKEAVHDIETRVMRFNTYLTFNLKLKEDVTFMSVSYLQPDINKADDFRILSNNSVNFTLTKSLALSIKLDARYDSKPADSIKEYDLFSQVGLMIDF